MIYTVQTTVCIYTNSRSSMHYIFHAWKAHGYFHSEQALISIMGTMKPKRENKKSAYISSLCDHLICTDQCIMWAVTGSQPLTVILLFQCKVSWLSLGSLHWCSQLKCSPCTAVDEDHSQNRLLPFCWPCCGVGNPQQRCGTKLAEVSSILYLCSWNCRECMNAG